MSTQDRLAAFGLELINVHDWLREQLDRLRDDLSAATPPQSELRVHCLAFCTALTRHHTGEDDTAFPALAVRFPELAPVLLKLQQDHTAIEGILDRVAELVEGFDAAVGPDEVRRVRGELDGLAAIMESHFAYEEREIVTALNKLDVPGWHRDVPRFLDRTT
ncbi:hemerythrin domain-containing protein [Nonomuraea sp. NPDC050786]|uniref:hemerythrin domain-containing protein n=1 Tax=Nonomuraea sp. NPDC050786 TaxID=3154840 RepID=UPI00340B0D9E